MSNRNRDEDRGQSQDGMTASSLRAANNVAKSTKKKKKGKKKTAQEESRTPQSSGDHWPH